MYKRTIAILMVMAVCGGRLCADEGDTVQLGASAKQVFATLGKPLGRVTKGTKTTWLYAKGSVVFEDNKVVETTFKDRQEEMARSQALLDAGKQKTAAESAAGLEQMRRMPPPVQTVPVPVSVSQVKTSDEYEKARADATARVTAAKVKREESLRGAKETLAAAEARAKEEVAIDPDAVAKKHALALRAYEAEVKQVDVVYQEELAQINEMMKRANARYAHFMAEQARLTKQKQGKQQKQLRQTTGSFQDGAQNTTAYPKLVKGGTKCPTCGRPVVAPTGEVITQADRKFKVYECVDGHKCLGE